MNCSCGCGKPAPISKKTRSDRGYKKGEPQQFINGHNSHRHSDAAKQAIAAAGRGRRPTQETRARLSAAKTGDRNPAWRGGVHTRRKRRLIYLGKGRGYALEHRLVMEDYLGRSLRSDEHVHHLDLDSTNNDPSNLIVLSASEHSRVHRMIDWHGTHPIEAVRAVCEVTV